MSVAPAAAVAVPAHRRVRRDHWAALALFLLASSAALVHAGQPLAKLTTSVLGLGGDPYQTLWRFDGLVRAIARGSLDVSGDPIRNLGPLPWLPLHLLIGEPLAVNLVWLAQAPLAALATFLLGRSFGLRPLAASLAGLLAAFAPYRVAESLGHFGAMQLFWIPGTLAAFLGFLRAPSPARAGILALLLIGTSWTEHTLFLTTLVALFVASLLNWHSMHGVLARRSSCLLTLAALAAVSALGVFPFRRELALVAGSESPLAPSAEQRWRFAPTGGSLLTPAAFHLVRPNPTYGDPRDTVADRTHFLGAAASLIGLGGVLAFRRVRNQGTGLLLLLSVVGVALAVAPRVPGVASAVSSLPLFSAVRVTNRFLVLPAFAVPLLAAGALQALWFSGSGKGRFRRPLAFLFALLLVFEILPAVPFPAQSAGIPPFVALLVSERPGPILEIPAASDYLVASRAIHASAVHGREPIAHIAFERVTDHSAKARLLRVPIFRDLLLLRVADLERPTFFGQDPETLAHAALASEGIVAVVLHGTIDGRPVLRPATSGLAPAGAEDIARVRAFLTRVGFAEEPAGPDTFVFLVPPWPNGRSAVVAVSGPGWERSGRREDETRHAALAGSAELEVRVMGASSRTLELSFRAAPGSRAGSVSIVGPAGRTQVAARPGELVRLPLGTLAPGHHAFTMLLDAPEILIENPSVTDQTSDGPPA